MKAAASRLVFSLLCLATWPAPTFGAPPMGTTGGFVFAYGEDVAALGCGERVGRGAVRGYTLAFTDQGLSLEVIRGDGTVPGTLWRVDAPCLESLTARLSPSARQSLLVEVAPESGAAAADQRAWGFVAQSAARRPPTPEQVRRLLDLWASMDLAPGALLHATPPEMALGWHRAPSTALRNNPSLAWVATLAPPAGHPEALRSVHLDFGHRRHEPAATWSDGSPVSAHVPILPAQGQALLAAMAGLGFFTGPYWVEPRLEGGPPAPAGVSTEPPKTPAGPHVRLEATAHDEAHHHRASMILGWDATGRAQLLRLARQLDGQAAALLTALAMQLPGR